MNPSEGDETSTSSSDSWKDQHSESAPGREDRRVSPKPGEWIVHRQGFDTEGTASRTTKILRHVYRRFSAKGTIDADSETWTKVAGAEIAAVGQGRKPVFHEETIVPGATFADAIRPVLPHLHVEGRGTHIVVADPAQLQRLGATMADVWRAVKSDNIGIFLGYGVKHWQEGTAKVLIFAGDGTMLAGFHTLIESAAEFGEERAKDYDAAFAGVYFLIEAKAPHHTI